MKFPPVTFTLDLEDHLQTYLPKGRFVKNTYHILDWLDHKQIRATIFSTGQIGISHPNLIKEVVKRGHELACHSLLHIPLTRLSPDQFEEDTRQAKENLEQASGYVVNGYRAPYFSLIASTIWSVNILKKLGFLYSSSVMPTKNPLHGFAQAPVHPFQWKCGLIEFPAPYLSLGPLRVAYLGGVYLRYIPLFLIRHGLKHHSSNQVLWSYIHPYDIDHEEPFSQIPQIKLWMNVLLWRNRKHTFKKLENLFQQQLASPLIEQVVQLQKDNLPTFTVGNHS